MSKAYPNDLTWQQWELIADLFPEAKSGGRPRTTALYGVMNAILYILCQGFVHLPKRWVVERTFGWLNWCRRLSKDYERLPENSETFIYIAMIRIMVRRLA
ncbi:MAG: transposase [Tolypothrix brevis GSE-NOS-MK-07-07A]|jgi:transposase|nr:transposase [Tolypothrix brevis GSE-NOS-MK-07-07A]